MAHLEAMQSSPKVLPPGPKPPTRSHDHPSRFWAVLIGIDAYLAGHNLNGCVSDVRAMENYLINDLHVPNDHIQCLLSPHPPPGRARIANTLAGLVNNRKVASRDNIVKTLLGLIKNPKIQFDDNIIVYFSGHGSSYECPEHKGNPPPASHLCGIEAICPSDRNTIHNKTIITDITDRELNAILTQICRAKGSHITVVMDCCFSASITRAPIPTGVRSIPRLQQSELDGALRIADKRLRVFPEYKCVLDEKWCPNMESHVLLAACREHEFAREEGGHGGDTNGIFTLALLRALKSNLADDVTYETLLSQLTASPNQTPVIAGTQRAAKLWYRE